MRWLDRLRHSLGFGVHSPLAFRLINEVLADDTPYYDFHKVKSKRDRLIYRLVCFFQPETACAAEHEMSIILMADSRVKAVSDGADFIVGAPEKLPDGDFTALLDGGDYHRLPEIISELDERGHGIVLNDHLRKRAIVIASPKLPRQEITVRI